MSIREIPLPLLKIKAVWLWAVQTWKRALQATLGVLSHAPGPWEQLKNAAPLGFVRSQEALMRVPCPGRPMGRIRTPRGKTIPKERTQKRSTDCVLVAEGWAPVEKGKK